jgi:pentatricopeptide repeat protein
MLLLQEIDSSSDVTSDVITYNTVLTTYCRVGDMAAAFSLFDQLQSNADLTPTVRTYNILLNGCASCKPPLPDKARFLLADMKVKGFEYSEYTFTALIKVRIDGAATF